MRGDQHPGLKAQKAIVTYLKILTRLAMLPPPFGVITGNGRLIMTSQLAQLLKISQNTIANIMAKTAAIAPVL